MLLDLLGLLLLELMTMLDRRRLRVSRRSRSLLLLLLLLLVVMMLLLVRVEMLLHELRVERL